MARITNPYGPGQPSSRTAYGVINRMIHLAIADRPLTIYGPPGTLQLVTQLFEAMAPAEAFAVVGEATAADIDLRGDMRVFERAGDSTAVYTYSAPTADDGGLWLAWRATTS